MYSSEYVHIVQSPQDGHLLRLRPPGGSGYFSSDLLLLFLRYYQAVPVHVEEVEDDAMGIFQPQLPISTAFFDTNPGALRVLLLNGDILLGLNANLEFVSV